MEQGGAAALRLLCMREMPVHQVFCNQLQNALCTTCIRSENTTGNVACALLAVLRCCSWLVLCWPLLLLSLLRHLLLLLSLLRHLCMRSQVLLNNGLYTTNIKANREMTFQNFVFCLWIRSQHTSLPCCSCRSQATAKFLKSKFASIFTTCQGSMESIFENLASLWHRCAAATAAFEHTALSSLPCQSQPCCCHR